MRTITVNGKKYNARPFDFNLIIDLEDMGISMTDMSSKPTGTLRAYVALCMGIDKDVAGIEMQNHLINGDNFDAIAKVMGEEMEESDFFRALKQTQTTEVATNQKKKAEK